jgi:hypothetical protein
MSQISVQNNVNIVDVNTKNNQVLVTDPTLPTTVTIDNTITEVVEVITPGPQGPPGDPSIFTSSFVNIDVYNEFTSSYNTGSFTGSFSGSGAGLTDIPASGIVGLNLSQIISGSVSASISPDSGLQVNTNVIAPSFTGSLFGTSSWAVNAQTASFVTGSNVFGPFGSNSILSASFAVSASTAVSSSFAVSASFASTASVALNVPTQTSQLTNNGQNGEDPFVDNQDNLVIKLEYSWEDLGLDPDTATDLDIELAIQNQIEGYKVDERQHLYIVIDNGDEILNIFSFFDVDEVNTINDFETQIGFTLDNPTIEYVGGITTITFTNSEYFIPNNSFDSTKLIYVKSYAKEIGLSSFRGSTTLEEIDFPILEIIGNGSFAGCSNLSKMNLPSVIFYGDDTGNNNVFNDVTDNEIEITTPIIHQTSNGGGLEGDLEELNNNNGVTFNWI